MSVYQLKPETVSDADWQQSLDLVCEVSVYESGVLDVAETRRRVYSLMAAQTADTAKALETTARAATCCSSQTSLPLTSTGMSRQAAPAGPAPARSSHSCPQLGVFSNRQLPQQIYVPGQAKQQWGPLLSSAVASGDGICMHGKAEQMKGQWELNSKNQWQRQLALEFARCATKYMYNQANRSYSARRRGHNTSMGFALEPSQDQCNLPRKTGTEIWADCFSGVKQLPHRSVHNRAMGFALVSGPVC